jgi:hypothetical protein
MSSHVACIAAKAGFAANLTSSGSGTLREDCTMTENVTPAVTQALSAAAIPLSKVGPGRHEHLSDREREFYFWILRRSVASGRPSGEEIREAAARLGLDVEESLERLAAQDLVHLDRAGEIAVAYPFSGRPTDHHVRFAGGHVADAMCAIDALGMAPMFNEEIEINSRDPLPGEQIEVRLSSGGTGAWEPQAAVVVCGASGGGESCSSCCPVLNFFASRENGERWLEGRPDVQGYVMTMPEAMDAGRAVFGDVLEAR